MNSRQAPPTLWVAGPLTRRAGVALLLLGWLLGVAVAMEHRVAHGGAGSGEAHLAGGHHPDDEGSCWLVDQVGLGDSLPAAPAVPSAPVPGLAAAPAFAAAWPQGTLRRAYQARGPPG